MQLFVLFFSMGCIEKREGFLAILKHFYLLCVMLSGSYYTVYTLYKITKLSLFELMPYLNQFLTGFRDLDWF